MPDSLSLKITFLDYGFSRLNKRWRGQTFGERYARLYYVTQGEAKIWHHAQEFTLTPSKLFLIPPNSNMRFLCKKSFTVIWFHFNILTDGDVDIFSIFSFLYVKDEPDKFYLKNKMLEIISLINRNDISNFILSRSILLELISYFITDRENEKKNIKFNKFERLQKAMKYAEKHCTEKISIEKLARIAAYERTYFSKIFKEVFSYSPLEFILRCRINKARFLIETSELKISAIARETGFNDEFHFSKTFKKVIGQSPRNYRKKISKIIP
ncbi:MAG TPA: AraC family transcriptional regulator [Victivallales bacterium]|nr:AraC family transcriptional regulator [Victivallales bacterium]